MKKLMFAATAILCGAVMAADITSANVVGYQQQSLDANYNILCVNFENASGAVPKLGDFKVNDNYANSPLNILSSTLAVDTITLPEVSGIEQETVDASFEYWTEEWLEEETVVYGTKATGWFLRDSNGNLYNMSNYAVAFGKSVCVDCTDDDAAVQFAGQVSSEPLPVDLVANYNLTGNCTPRDITLGDVTVNDNYANSPLNILSSTLAVETITLPEVSGIEQETVDASFEYWTEDWLEEETVVYGTKATGWYLRDSNGNLYNMNSYVVPAGKGLVVDCTDDDAQIILPEGI